MCILFIAIQFNTGLTFFFYVCLFLFAFKQISYKVLYNKFKMYIPT